MKHSVIFTMVMICSALLYPMEKSTQSVPLLQKINLLRKKTKNKIYFYNESENVMVLYYGKKKEKVLNPKGYRTIKLKILRPLTVKTGDLSQQFSLDKYKEGLQRFKINASCTEITINPWEEGS